MDGSGRLGAQVVAVGLGGDGDGGVAFGEALHAAGLVHVCDAGQAGHRGLADIADGEVGVQGFVDGEGQFAGVDQGRLLLDPQPVEIRARSFGRCVMVRIQGWCSGDALLHDSVGSRVHGREG